MVAYVCNTSNQEAGAGGHEVKASLSNIKNYFKKERGVKEREIMSKIKKYNYLSHQIHNVVTQKLIFTEYTKEKIEFYSYTKTPIHSFFKFTPNGCFFFQPGDEFI